MEETINNIPVSPKALLKVLPSVSEKVEKFAVFLRIRPLLDGFV
jgi:hypothetical protein